MSAGQRRKGAQAERELRRLLNDELGISACRNFAQSFQGGCDLIGVGPWALEVKRQERLTLQAWWRQACRQAGVAIPALAYRQSRRPWLVQVPLEYVLGHRERQDWLDRPTATLNLEGFCLLTRELIAEEASHAAGD